jgi:subtilisin family serine protease
MRRGFVAAMLGTLVVTGGGVPLPASAGQAAVRAHPHGLVGPVAQMALNMRSRGSHLSRAIAVPSLSGGAESYGLFIRGKTTAAAIAATGARPGTVLSVGATAYGTLDQVTALSALAGVTEVDLAGQGQRRLDVSVPDIRASEPGHASTAGIPHLWSGAPGAFSGDRGQGVVVGVVDTGIDIQNPDFKTVGGQSRVAFLWDQVACADKSGLPTADTCEGSPGVGGHPSEGGYGQVCTAASIDAGTCGPFNYYQDCLTPADFGYPYSASFPYSAAAIVSLPEQDCLGHGTHVAGTAAANGRATSLSAGTFGAGGASNGKYTGVAPEATIVAVKIGGDLARAVDGVRFIFDRASGLGMPASVNLSFGPNGGPHDGTSMFETMLDALSGPGHVISAAAGNTSTGSPSLHYHASSNLLQGQVAANPLRIGGAPVLVDIWYPGSAAFSISASGPGAVMPPLQPPAPGAVNPAAADGTCNPGGNNTQGGATDPATGNQILVVSCTNMPGNHDNEIQLFIVNLNNADLHVSGCSASAPCVDNWQFTLKAESGSGTWHAWTFDQADYLFHNGFGSDSSTVGSPGTAHKVLSVGSYSTIKAAVPGGGGGWANHSGGTSYDARQQAAEQVSGFSSIGPTRDGRTGIDVLAPGQEVGSSLSAHADSSTLTGCAAVNSSGVPIPGPDACEAEDGAHLYLQGTSTSAPHVAGAVALMLKENPSLDVAGVRRVIADTANTTNAGVVPSLSYGSGNLRLGPGVATVSPTIEELTGGQPITISGFDFQPGMTITYDGVTYPVSPTDAGHIQFTPPAAAQPHPVSVSFTNPDGSAGADPLVFSYVAPFAVLPAVSNGAYGGYVTAATVQNTGSAPATVHITYFDQAGLPVGAGDEVANLPVNASWTVRQDNGRSFPASGGDASQAGSAVVYSTQPVASFVNEFPPGNAGDATSYTGVAVPGGVGTTLYAPTIVNNAYGGYTTGIGLLNMGTASTDVTVTYRDGTGAVLKTQSVTGLASHAYHALYSGDLTLALPDGFAGTATISSTGGQVLGAIVNETGPGGQLSSYDAVATGATLLNAPAALNNAYGGFFTGMGIQNTSGSAGSVSVTYYDSGGAATPRTFSIPAYGYLGVYQGSGTDGPAVGAYTAVIQSSLSLAAIVNEVAPVGAGPARQSTSYNTFGDGSARLHLPLVENAGSDPWNTGEGIMNTGTTATAVTVTYYDSATGSTIGSPQALSLAPHAFWGLYQPSGGLAPGSRATAVVTTNPAGQVAVVCNESSPTTFMSYSGQ